MMTNSRNLRGKALIEYKQSLKLNDLQREVLIGTLLGDATIPLKLGKPTYQVKFEQQIARKEYIEHLYQIFEPFVGTPPKIRNISGGGAKDRQSIWFRTYGHPAFKYYYDVFYIQQSPNERRIKRVPSDIHKLLTPRSLAYWFMDDGILVKGDEYRFSTHCFDLSDQKRLQIALKQIFDIQVNIQKDRQKYRLYIRRNSEALFTQTISEFIHPIFAYKIKTN